MSANDQTIATSPREPATIQIRTIALYGKSPALPNKYLIFDSPK